MEDVKKRCAVAFEIANTLFPELREHNENAFKAACEGIAILKKADLLSMHERSLMLARTTHFIQASAHDFYRLEQKYEVERDDMRKEYAQNEESLSDYPEKNIPQEHPVKDVASEAPFYISEEAEAGRKKLNELTPDLKDGSEKVYPEKNIPQEHPKKASLEVVAGQNNIMQHSTEKVVKDGDVAVYSQEAEEENPHYKGLEKDEALKSYESGAEDLSGQYLKQKVYDKTASMDEYPEEEPVEAPVEEEMEVESSLQNDYGVSFDLADEQDLEDMEAEQELFALFGGDDEMTPMVESSKKVAKLTKIPNQMLNVTASKKSNNVSNDMKVLFGQ